MISLEQCVALCVTKMSLERKVEKSKELKVRSVALKQKLYLKN